uniref:DUF1985 domain-containing protein n=1 Tax=Solanum lycopersicum TaxID=4081 RepID=A0A3Q7G8D3_SOLLC
MYFMPKTFIETEDMFKMTLIYIKETFLLYAQPTRNYVRNLHFDLVDRGKYKDYPWGNLCFLYVGKRPPSMKYGGLFLALQIWFYECCTIIDTLIPQRVRTCIPRILNWQI